jgi:outer membrane lipopolysaccharide assembly protein LptE/RlpB
MGETLTKLRLKSFGLTLKACGWKLLNRLGVDRNSEVKTGEFGHQMGWVALESQLREPYIERQVTAELDCLQLLKLLSKQHL